LTLFYRPLGSGLFFLAQALRGRLLDEGFKGNWGGLPARGISPWGLSTDPPWLAPNPLIQQEQLQVREGGDGGQQEGPGIGGNPHDLPPAVNGMGPDQGDPGGAVYH
jgi:hypothetical protein